MKRKKKGLLGLPQRVSASPVIDFAIGFFGLCLAALSAWFPWYVYNNEKQFGPPRLVLDGRRNAPPGSDPQMRRVAQEDLPSVDAIGLDTTTTGSIGQPSARLAGTDRQFGKTTGSLKVLQPAPRDFEVIFVSRGRALLRDGGDLIPVARGAVLPDGSKVESIRQRNGVWELQTSADQTLQWQR